MRHSANLKLASVSEPAPTHEVLVASAAQVVSAYVMNRPQEQVNLTQLLADVYHTLASLGHEVRPQAHAPSIAIEKSVTDDYIICLEDGKQVKMLKRYLKSAYNMSPEEYRARWNLPNSYPMVAPNYAIVRSKLAKEIGLGRRGMPTVAKQFVEKRAGR